MSRTFRAEFRWFITKAYPPRLKVGKAYRNRVALALEWQKAIDSGYYTSQADLARKRDISRARVTQILNVLRLAPEVIGIATDLGDPLPAPTVTERQLRRLINLPAQAQLKEIMTILGVIQSAGEITRRP